MLKSIGTRQVVASKALVSASILFFISFFLAVVTIRAQQLIIPTTDALPPDTGQSQGGKSEEEEEYINPARPGVSNPAEFQKPGVLQVEYGYDANFRGQDFRLQHRASVAPEATFVQADLMDGEQLRRTLLDGQVEAVIHMAADSLVGESVSEPAKYYRNNLVAGLALLDAMRDGGVRRIVFSSTAAVYGEPEKQPIEETDPTKPTNPYGESKLSFERALRWYENAYGIHYASLRYFNAAGASSRCGEAHDPETHLIPAVLQAATGKRAEVEIFGEDYPTRDGTCVRDYIHVVDLARAHILALGILDERSAIYNLGCGGEGYSVREVIDVAREVTGRDIPVRHSPRRAGDPAVLIASSARIREELGWMPERQDLKTIIRSAWEWMQEHPDGYQY